MRAPCVKRRLERFKNSSKAEWKQKTCSCSKRDGLGKAWTEHCDKQCAQRQGFTLGKVPDTIYKRINSNLVSNIKLNKNSFTLTVEQAFKFVSMINDLMDWLKDNDECTLSLREWKSRNSHISSVFKLCTGNNIVGIQLEHDQRHQFVLPESQEVIFDWYSHSFSQRIA